MGALIYVTGENIDVAYEESGKKRKWHCQAKVSISRKTIVWNA
jgi:hypothetical protein